MEEQTKTFVDPSQMQEVQQTNPIEKNRKPTDRMFMYLFLLMIIVWFGAGISGLTAEQKRNDSHLRELRSLINLPFSSFYKDFVGLSFAIILSLLLGTGFMLFSVFLNGKLTKFFIYVGMGIYVLATISNCVKFIFGPKGESDGIYRNISQTVPLEILLPTEVIYQAWFLIKTIFMIVSVISFFKVDHKVLLNIIKDVNRFILGTPSLILFMSFITILGYLAFSFSMNAMIAGLSSERSVYRTVPEYLILILGGISTISFIYYFAYMVISECTVNHYWENRGISVLGQCIGKTLRNHIGTIMFSSTIFLPFICALVQAIKHNRSWKQKEIYIFYFLSKVSIVLNIEYTALIFSSIYGTGFVKSTKKSFDTLLRHCLLYLATIGVIDALLAIMLMITSILMLIVLGVLSAFSINVFTNPSSLISVLCGFTIPVVSFVMLMYASSRALLINKAIISNKEEQYSEGKTEILNRL